MRGGSEREIVTVEMKTHFFLEASDLRAICTDGGDGAYIQTVGTGGAVPIRERARARASSPAACDKYTAAMGIRGPERYAVSGHGKRTLLIFFPYPISNGCSSNRSIIILYHNNNIIRFYFSTFFFLSSSK